MGALGGEGLDARSMTKLATICVKGQVIKYPKPMNMYEEIG